MRFLIAFGSSFILAAVSAAQPKSSDANDLFEAKVRPLLVEKCVSCHGPKKAMAGLRLDTAAGLKAGSDAGPVVTPGDPEKSTLVKAIRRQGDSPMPPNEPLKADSVEVLTAWVKAGATFPDGVQQHTTVKATDHWAFKPVRDPAVPTTKFASANPIDRFVAAKLEAQKLSLSPPADKRTLIRRVYFDLIGLPPPADEIDAFEKNTAPDAFAELVDRLLSSPQYGERWGRYWLDLARYADSKGYVFQEERSYPYAYTYRDYVIRSLNADVPYNRFVTEQLAADRVPNPDPNSLAALGFLTVGRRFMNNPHDIIDDRIDVVTRGLLGLTVQCARCHDHKFDPVPAADYYSLYGVFASIEEPKELPLLPAGERTADNDAFDKELAKREKALADLTEKLKIGRKAAFQGAAGSIAAVINREERLLNRADRNETQKFQRRIDQLKATHPGAPARAMAVADKPQPFDAYVFLRGKQENHGPRVPRQFVSVAAPDRKPFGPGSGRLDLAKAITDPKNPLTARVIVNRVWLGHFGHGLVRTPSDFGTRSDPPTHPELLDWLATRFVRDDGWSLKKLHRRILLSATYQQSSVMRPDLAGDPENRLLGRQTRKRHDFETLRDSLLSAAGTIDLSKVGGRSVDVFKFPFTKRRSMYALTDRQNLSPTLRAFDAASPDSHTPQRFQTTVPQQALFLMNSPFVADQARAVAARKEVASATDLAGKVRQMYRVVVGRDPTTEERELAVAFASAKPTDDLVALKPLEQLAQVLLLSNEFAFAD